jgi:hypothetical protein
MASAHLIDEEKKISGLTFVDREFTLKTVGLLRSEDPGVGLTRAMNHYNRFARAVLCLLS